MNKETLLTHKGKSLSIAKWSRHTGLPYNTIYARLSMGWKIERVLERPIRKNILIKGESLRGRREREQREAEKRQIREWLSTQPADIEERREEGDIL